jgi:hypothetical protein
VFWSPTMDEKSAGMVLLAKKQCGLSHTSEDGSCRQLKFFMRPGHAIRPSSSTNDIEHCHRDECKSIFESISCLAA